MSNLIWLKHKLVPNRYALANGFDSRHDKKNFIYSCEWNIYEVKGVQISE